ncbi:MAG: N-acetylmuramoyl-L-alanine amidase family 2 [Candidatus Peregrinibacteria bacterium GW2011_GWA2_47_7]|nr:MAG: N-acetylmuramoyl-L-alanine amidase family 2 [Candidatus Peregrinibacteria bacterium GW2011_GWA2_47_7]
MDLRRLIIIVLLVFFTFNTPTSSAAEEATTEKPFTALIIRWQNKSETTRLEIRIKEKDGWSEWYAIEDDPDRDEHETHAISNQPEVFFTTNESSQYQYSVIGDMEGLSITPFSYETKKTLPLLAGINIPGEVNIIPRSAWGANAELLYNDAIKTEETAAENKNGNGDEAQKSENGDQNEIERIVESDPYGRPYHWPVQYAKDIKFIVIHHTASVKNLDNPAVAIQNIYAYHAVTRKWGDIGYNFVIDQQGNIYEGRQGGDKVIGGHTLALNKVSVGIAVLGDYQEEEIPPSVLRSLLTLTNYLSKKHTIDPDGFTTYKEEKYANFGGHRDSANTTCPGDYLYQKLFGIRELVTYKQTKQRTQPVAAYNFSDSSKRSVITVSPESEKTFTIQLKNTGEKSWKSGTVLKNKNDLPDDPDTVQFLSNPKDPSIIATLKSPKEVKTGETGTFQGRLASGLKSGLLVYDAALAVGKNAPSKKAIPIPILVEGVRGSYEIVQRHDPKNLLRPGEETEGWIELKNTGNVIWKAEGAHPLRIHPDQPRDRTSAFFKRIVLEQESVLPGEVGKFVFYITAPEKEGTYTEYFTPVIEEIRWLENQNLAFDFVVQKKKLKKSSRVDGPIRIALAFKEQDTIELQGSTRSILYDGATRLQTVSNDETVTVKLTSDGKYRLTLGEKVKRVTGPIRMQTVSNDGYIALKNFERRPAWNKKINDNIFSGIVEIITEDGKLRAVNELPLEDYLKGLAEVSNDEYPEKIKAITVAARSYAVYYMTQGVKFPGKPYHLDDDPENTQKYLGRGVTKRADKIVQAVDATRGQVVTYNGKVIKTPYFSQSDGKTRSGKEVFGWDNTPYLQSVPDPACLGKTLKGHGVGMSGCGARAMAEEGKTYREIIKYYYKGVEITD